MADTKDTATRELTEPQKAWVAALRSGEYKQGKKRLHSEADEFCCLGVACDLALKDGILKGREVVGGEWSYCGDPDTDDIGWTALAPYAVRDWLGLRENDAAFGFGDDEDQLTAWNDRGESFERIADLIESRPDGLFVEPKS